MTLTFITGARGTGKTHNLLATITSPFRTMVVVANRQVMANMNRELRHVRKITGVEVLLVHDAIDKLLGKHEWKVLIEEVGFFTREEQIELLVTQPRYNEVVATVSPCIINAVEPPIFWQVMKPTNTINLGGRHDGDRIRDISPISYVMDYQGYFVVKPSKTAP